MGTRGTITIIYNGRIIKIFNQYDSYPDGLGKDLVDEIKKLILKYGLESMLDG